MVYFLRRKSLRFSVTCPKLYDYKVCLNPRVNSIIGISIGPQHMPLNCINPVPSDIEISQTLVSAGLPSIQTIASSINIDPFHLLPWGAAKAKVSLATIDQTKSPSSLSSSGNYVVVTGINPTPLGEGKSTTTIGLCQALFSPSVLNLPAVA